MREIKELKDLSKKPNDFKLVLLGLGLLVIISILIGIAGFVLGNRLQNNASLTSFDLLDVSTKCISSGGTWIGTSQECENVSEPFCRNLSGKYDACASQCRNMVGEVMCIQSCVQVCSFR